MAEVIGSRKLHIEACRSRQGTPGSVSGCLLGNLQLRFVGICFSSQPFSGPSLDSKPTVVSPSNRQTGARTPSWVNTRVGSGLYNVTGTILPVEVYQVDTPPKHHQATTYTAHLHTPPPSLPKMHLPSTLLLLTPFLAHSLHLPPTTPDALTSHASISRRQTPTPDPHITDFRGWELTACTGENQGVQTVTQSQVGQCLAFPVEVRALTLNRIVEGCTGELRTDGVDSLLGCADH